MFGLVVSKTIYGEDGTASVVDYRRVRSVSGFIIGIFVRMTFPLSIFGEQIIRFDNMKLRRK